MAESSQRKVGRVRPPMVQIMYEVNTDGALEKKELPFIVGVMGDFSGDPTVELKPLKERGFKRIDINNFDEIMKGHNVGLKIRVPNVLDDDGSEIAADLKFKGIDDFSPARVAEQIEPLKKLLETRQQLTELINKIDRSVDLEKLLEKVLTDDNALKKLSEELKI